MKIIYIFNFKKLKYFYKEIYKYQSKLLKQTSEIIINMTVNNKSSNIKYIKNKSSKYYKKNTNVSIFAYNIHNNNIFNLNKIFNNFGIIQKVIVNSKKKTTIIYFKKIFNTIDSYKIMEKLNANKNYIYKNILINKYSNKKSVKNNKTSKNKKVKKNKEKIIDIDCNLVKSQEEKILDDLFILSKNMAESVLIESPEEKILDDLFNLSKNMAEFVLN